MSNTKPIHSPPPPKKKKFKQAILTPHLTPFLAPSSFQISLTPDELPVITGLMTNTILLYSSLDGQAMPGAMALSSWTEKLVDAYRRTADLGRKQELGEGIVRGLTERTEPSLATREFTAKVQIVGALRNGECGFWSRPRCCCFFSRVTHFVCCLLGTVNAAIYGKGSTEARNADAILGSKFI